jgi:hypothetical protein
MKKEKRLPRHVKLSFLSMLMIAMLLVPVIQEEGVSEKYVEIIRYLTYTLTARHDFQPQITFPSTLKVSAGILSSERSGFTRVKVTIPGNLLNEYVWTDEEIDFFLVSLENEVSQICLNSCFGMPWLISWDPAARAAFLLLLERQTTVEVLGRRGITVGSDPPKTALFDWKQPLKTPSRVWTFTFNLESADEPVTSWGIGFGNTAFAWTKLPLRLSSTAPITITDVRLSRVETFSLQYQTSTDTRTETIVDRRQRHISFIQWLLKISSSTSSASTTSRTTVTTTFTNTTTTSMTRKIGG